MTATFTRKNCLINDGVFLLHICSTRTRGDFHQLCFFQNKFNMTAMEGIRERSRHHHRIFTGKSDDIASLLALPNMDAHKLWNLTSHSKQSMIKEVGISIYFSHCLGMNYYVNFLGA